jgi:hypothetical protein
MHMVLIEEIASTQKREQILTKIRFKIDPIQINTVEKIIQHEPIVLDPQEHPLLAIMKDTLHHVP